MTLLAIDSGNTSISFGFFDQGVLKHVFRCSNSSTRMGDEYYVWLQHLSQQQGISLQSLDYCVISSVVPEALENLINFARRAFGDRFTVFNAVHPALPMKILTDSPASVGSDMLASCLSAYQRYPEGNLIVVDCGTATTFSYLNAEGSFCGCLIAPGLKTSLHALCSAGALLPRVSFSKPDKVLGKNTVECISSGMYYGFVGLLQNCILMLKREIATLSKIPSEQIKVLMTGGYSLHFDLPEVTVKDEFLLLKGLWNFYQNIKQS